MHEQMYVCVVCSTIQLNYRRQMNVRAYAVGVNIHVLHRRMYIYGAVVRAGACEDMVGFFSGLEAMSGEIRSDVEPRPSNANAGAFPSAVSSKTEGGQAVFAGVHARRTDISCFIRHDTGCKLAIYMWRELDWPRLYTERTCDFRLGEVTILSPISWDTYIRQAFPQIAAMDELALVAPGHAAAATSVSVSGGNGPGAEEKKAAAEETSCTTSCAGLHASSQWYHVRRSRLRDYYHRCLTSYHGMRYVP